ncbi:MAG: hypothetical protein MUF24_02280 [Chitinophagaceae bacterium]|jgi:hypothetical protein|nr:hypothetical protein [Chitinophagaceae bacterium]
MKKLFAITMLGLMLFSSAGYRLWVNWLEWQARHLLQQDIELNRYNTAEIIEITVPINLPYTTDWQQWEQIEGSIQANGKVYQYVERKLEKGHMTYRCLPNRQMELVVSARDNFMQLGQTLLKNGGHTKPLALKTIITPPVFEMVEHHTTTVFSPVFTTRVPNNYYYQAVFLPNPPLSIPVPPPDI